MSKISFDHIVKMINHHRHDWLNHIQVLHGLLKLESYEAMKQYLDKITIQLQQDQYISQLRNTEFILYIHTYPARNRTLLFEVELAESIHLDEANITDEQIQLLIELIEIFSQNSLIKNDVLPSLVLTMGKLDHKVQFTIDFVGYLNEKLFLSEWNRARQQLLALGAIIDVKEQNENEWLLDSTSCML